MRITKRRLRAWGACYGDEKLTELWSRAFGKRVSVTPLEFAMCNHPKKGDLLWVLLRPEIIPDMELHELACKFAEAALLAERKAGREPDLRLWRDAWDAWDARDAWAAARASQLQLVVEVLKQEAK